MLLGASELCKMRVSLAVVRQSCFLTLVAAHPEAAVPCEQDIRCAPSNKGVGLPQWWLLNHLRARRNPL